MIGRTNAGFGGGGGGLRVAVGLTAPVNPRENTVWVKSDKAGKKYVFAEVFPKPRLMDHRIFVESEIHCLQYVCFYIRRVGIGGGQYVHWREVGDGQQQIRRDFV